MAERIPTVVRSSNVDNAGAAVKTYTVLGIGGGNSQKPLTVQGYVLQAATGTLWIQLHATGAAPAANAVPFWPPFLIQAGQYFTIELGSHGVDLDALTVALSTAENKYTAVGTAWLVCSVVILG